MSHVTLTQDGSRIVLTVLLGQTTPVISAGVSTWDTVPRPKRESITRYTGRTPFIQSIPVMFDSWADYPRTSQEGRINKLVTMASQPHPVTLSGHALRKDLDWVITDVAWDDQDTIWMRIGGNRVRVRQSAVITLLEYNPDVVIKTPAMPSIKNPNKKPAKKYTVLQGLTLKQIAQIEFGDPDKWRRIVDENIILIGVTDPRYRVSPGVELIIVDGAIPYFTVP